METYLQVLKSHELKITQHRLEILRYLDAHRTHPTADEIYKTLKKVYPSLSKTTVYNTLEALAKAGIIQQLTISPTELRYEFRHDMHHHFICKRCGCIIDIDFACPNVKIISRDIMKNGHQIDEVHGYFKGICKQCLDKEERNNG